AQPAFDDGAAARDRDAADRRTIAAHRAVGGVAHDHAVDETLDIGRAIQTRSAAVRRACGVEFLTRGRGGGMGVGGGERPREQKREKNTHVVAGAAPDFIRSKIGRKNSGSCAPATAYCRSKM